MITGTGLLWVLEWISNSRLGLAPNGTWLYCRQSLVYSGNIGFTVFLSSYAHFMCPGRFLTVSSSHTIIVLKCSHFESMLEKSGIIQNFGRKWLLIFRTLCTPNIRKTSCLSGQDWGLSLHKITCTCTELYFFMCTGVKTNCSHLLFFLQTVAWTSTQEWFGFFFSLLASNP